MSSLHPENHTDLRPSSSNDNMDGNTTRAPSAVPSVLNDQKELETSASATPSQSVTDKEDVAAEKANPGETDPEKTAEVASTEEEQTEYPSSWKLGFITIALCLSVFCMALVSGLNSPWKRLKQNKVLTAYFLGQHHYCDRYSPHH
jgi:hypothetical protein